MKSEKRYSGIKSTPPREKSMGFYVVKHSPFFWLQAFKYSLLKSLSEAVALSLIAGEDMQTQNPCSPIPLQLSHFRRMLSQLFSKAIQWVAQYSPQTKSILYKRPPLNELVWADIYLDILLEMLLPTPTDLMKIEMIQHLYAALMDTPLGRAEIESLLMLREQKAPLQFTALSAHLDLRSKELLAQATLLLATVHGSLSQTELASWRGLCQKLGLLPEHTQEILSAFLHTVHLPAPVSSQHFCLN